jgi:hypothetical protein
MTDRSIRREVRNPMLALPSVQRLASIDPDARAGLIDVLKEVRVDARERAEKCWRTHKAPMALYWKCVAVYAGHLARALNSKEGNRHAKIQSDVHRARRHPRDLGNQRRQRSRCAPVLRRKPG